MKAINRAGNLKRITSHPRRKIRQDEALERKANCATLTLAQRLKWLDQQGHTATRERKRLVEATNGKKP